MAGTRSKGRVLFGMKTGKLRKNGQKICIIENKALSLHPKTIGMPIDIDTLLGREVSEAEMVEMAAKCTNNDTRTVGGLKPLHQSDVLAIYRMARKSSED